MDLLNDGYSSMDAFYNDNLPDCGKECKQNPTPCNDTGFISRPITLQAVLNLINDALTFKDK